MNAPAPSCDCDQFGKLVILGVDRFRNNIAIEIHIRMDGSMSLKDAHEITKKIECAIKEEFGKETHIGIHMEPKKQIL